jgi:hypothetical protein
MESHYSSLRALHPLQLPLIAPILFAGNSIASKLYYLLQDIFFNFEQDI